LKKTPTVNAGYRSPIREQRVDRRKDCSVPVVWIYFNASKHFDGRMVDVSARGGCVESNQSVTPGSAVLVRLMSSDGSGTDWIIHSALLAEVKWCLTLPQQSAYNYRFGVKCFEYF
jgi:hypothetical protein